MRLLLYVGSIFVLGVLGVIGIYIRFLAVLVSILVNCVKISVEAAFPRLFSGPLGRPLQTKPD